MQTETIKPLSWYKYDTAKITILWKGITQPIGRFKTAEEALNTINSLCLNNTEITQFSIDTPNGVINYEDFKNQRNKTKN